MSDGVIKTIEMFQSTQVNSFLQSDSSLGVGYLCHSVRSQIIFDILKFPWITPH